MLKAVSQNIVRDGLEKGMSVRRDRLRIFEIVKSQVTATPALGFKLRRCATGRTTICYLHRARLQRELLWTNM